MELSLSHYDPPNKKDWQGRSDTAYGRVYQRVKCLDLTQLHKNSFTNAVGLIGFRSDEGVRRNQGRVGASNGPKAFRHAFSQLAVPHYFDELYDFGDIICVGQHLDKAQQDLAKTIKSLLQFNVLPLVIGGGHETAWGHYLGLEDEPFIKDLAIVNFDAHFDLRQDTMATSGTPFMQIAQHCDSKKIPFHYYCFGIQQQANTQELYESAERYQVHFRTVEEIYANPKIILEDLENVLQKHQAVYLSICLDVFAYPYAPGVSAISSQGLHPWQVIPAIIQLAKSQKVASMDVVELAPNYDQDNVTAKLAATLVSYFMQHDGINL